MRRAYYLAAAFFAFCLVFNTAAALAQTGADPAPIPIKAAWDLPDKAPVAVEGYITKSLAPHKYILAKDGEEIRVNVTDKVWGGDPTDEKQLIVVYGEIKVHGVTKEREIEASKIVRK